MRTDLQSGYDAQLREFYLALSRAWGAQHWWPARSRFEVILGAFLTQNTSWTNVELAIGQLRRERLLSLDGIRRTPLARLEQLVRSAGYYRQKAQRLKAFVGYLDQCYRGSLSRMFARPTPGLRSELLALSGIGPETADCILLYAGGHEVFVVDAYTRRVLERHGLAQTSTPYDEIRLAFERALETVAKERTPTPAAFTLASDAAHAPSPASRMRRSPLAQTFNEMHGLIVKVGKKHCLKAHPHCQECPLARFPCLLPPKGAGSSARRAALKRRI
jgi:endonuclease III related protein